VVCLIGVDYDDAIPEAQHRLCRCVIPSVAFLLLGLEKVLRGGRYGGSGIEVR